MPATHTATPSAKSPATEVSVEPFDVLDETHQQIATALKQLQSHALSSLLPDTRQDAQRIDQLADQRAEAHEGLPERKTTLLSVPTRCKWRSDVVQSKARLGLGSGVYWL